MAIIEHPPGAETQFDWVELPDPPSSWGCGREAHLLVGALSHSGRWRGVLAEGEDSASGGGTRWVLRRLGGVSDSWGFDRMSTVYNNSSGHVTAAWGARLAERAGLDLLAPAAEAPRRGSPAP